MWDEMWIVPAALTQAESRASSTQKNGREGSKRQDPLAPSTSLLEGVHSWPPTICARVQWVTRLEYALLYILCPLFAGCTELPSEALVKREANPKHTHCLQFGPHLPFPLQQPATTVSPLTSVGLQGKAACGLYLPVHPL